MSVKMIGLVLLMVLNGSLWASNGRKNITLDSPVETEVLDTQYIELGVLVGQMKYDKSTLRVKAGSPVSIVFKNNDIMVHNFLIVQIGSKEKVGMEADKMITQPNAQEKNYIPAVEEVLFYTPLVNPGKEFTLRFTAPEKKGEYPYICTFPAHWRIMQGVMKVE